MSLAAMLADRMVLGAALDELRAIFGDYTLLDHWKQGEFHHDVVIRAAADAVVVIATNCNGGIKEVLVFDQVPDRSALWRWRCPGNDEFDGTLAPIFSREVTTHWFDPCELLLPTARSELREEYRVRQAGGGWQCAIERPSLTPESPADPARSRP